MISIQAHSSLENRNPDLFLYKSIIVECTFLDDDDMIQALRTKHCHWKTLKPIIESHPQNNFILYHFSTRYKPEDIIFFFNKDENRLANVHIWTHSWCRIIFYCCLLHYVSIIMQVTCIVILKIKDHDFISLIIVTIIIVNMYKIREIIHHIVIISYYY